MLRVLLADDDPLIRFVLRRVVEDRGAVAVEASDAAGLRRAVADEGPFPLAVVDAGLPGDELPARLRELLAGSPTAQVLLVSGRAAPPCALEPRLRFVSKPFDVGVLADALDALRDRTAVAG